MCLDQMRLCLQRGAEGEALHGAADSDSVSDFAAQYNLYHIWPHQTRADYSVDYVFC
jgi:hypothetical protein